MKIKIFLIVIIFTLQSFAQEKLIIVNEGLWQTDNGKLTYFEDGEIISNEWFREINGYKLGDTPNDIIQINDNLIAISVNWSNIVQFITPEGKAVAQTEAVPNNRKLATDGKFVYATSYGHEVSIDGKYKEFTKGFVAKIDVSTFKVVDAVEVGYEPEGIAYYDGHLFVANTGGYAFQENHDYETTVSMINAETMTLVRVIETNRINLYGKMAISGKYLCINSPGDYYEMPASTIILDCERALDGLPDNECCITLDYSATYNTVDLDGNFLAVGSRYSYLTGDYEVNYITINPFTLFETNGQAGVTESLPGTIKQDMKGMAMPYGIYVNPYTGYIYATDSGEFTGAGSLYQWTPEGEFVGKYKTYINPAHFLALSPDPKANDNEGAGVREVRPSIASDKIYDLQGKKITNPLPGNIYIINGKKCISK